MDQLEDSQKDSRATMDASSKGDARVMRMGTASVPRLVVEFAIPSVVGMLVNGSYAIVNSIFLGNAMGEIGLSAITVANPMLIVFMAFAMLVGNGGNALAALRLGEGKRNEAERALGNVVLLSIVLAALVALAASNPFILDWVLTVSSSTEDVRPYASIYIQILSFGFIFQMIGMGVNNFIRTAGAPVRALVTMVIGLVSAAVFNYFFVILFGWGIVGSALASLAGQALLHCGAVVLHRREGRAHASALALHEARFFASWVPSSRWGFPSFAMQVGMALINFLLNYQLVKYGAMTVIGAENALASIGVVQRVAQFSVFSHHRRGDGNPAALGYNYGARIIPRVRSTYKCGVIGATAICVLVWSIIYLFTTAIVSAFGIVNDDLNEFTAVRDARAVHHAASSSASRSCPRTTSRQPGQPAKSIFLSLTRQILVPHPAHLVPARYASPYRPDLARA